MNRFLFTLFRAWRGYLGLTNRILLFDSVLVNTRRPQMSYEPPTPPAELPTDVVNTLNDYSPDQLQHVARYAEELAEHNAREARLEEESKENEIDERPDDLPDDVPSKATVTIKDINDNRYYYWQWRDGDTVTSKYKGPVNPDE
jgi:hypothetical protein